MHLDDFFIKNTNKSADIIANNDDVLLNDVFIDNVSGFEDFRRICIEHRIHKNVLELSVVYDKNKLTDKKIRELKEKILYVLESMTVSVSPVYFKLTRKIEENTIVWKLGSKVPNAEIFKKYENFGFTTHIDFENSIVSIVRCIIQLNCILEEIRLVTYNSSECKIGKWFEVGEHYMYPTAPKQYVFDWCGLQNEIFKNSEVTSLISKSKLLGLLLSVLDIFQEDKLNRVYLKIYDLLSKYNRRKLLKWMK